MAKWVIVFGKYAWKWWAEWVLPCACQCWCSPSRHPTTQWVYSPSKLWAQLGREHTLGKLTVCHHAYSYLVLTRTSRFIAQCTIWFSCTLMSLHAHEHLVHTVESYLSEHIETKGCCVTKICSEKWNNTVNAQNVYEYQYLGDSDNWSSDKWLPTVLYNQ